MIENCRLQVSSIQLHTINHVYVIYRSILIACQNIKLRCHYHSDYTFEATITNTTIKSSHVRIVL